MPDLPDGHVAKDHAVEDECWRKILGPFDGVFHCPLLAVAFDKDGVTVSGADFETVNVNIKKLLCRALRKVIDQIEKS